MFLHRYIVLCGYGWKEGGFVIAWVFRGYVRCQRGLAQTVLLACCHVGVKLGVWATGARGGGSACLNGKLSFRLVHVCGRRDPSHPCVLLPGSLLGCNREFQVFFPTISRLRGTRFGDIGAVALAVITFGRSVPIVF